MTAELFVGSIVKLIGSPKCFFEKSSSDQKLMQCGNFFSLVFFSEQKNVDWEKLKPFQLLTTFLKCCFFRVFFGAVHKFFLHSIFCFTDMCNYFSLRCNRGYWKLLWKATSWNHWLTFQLVMEAFSPDGFQFSASCDQTTNDVGYLDEKSFLK